MNKVLVIIPHYNNPKGLLKSISSIDKVEKVDIFIIDDGSSRIQMFNELEIQNNFKAEGTVFFHYLNENQGIEAALNVALDFALLHDNYKYISRLDCGDICLGKRFEIQYNFLEKNPNVKLVGCSSSAYDTNGDFLYNLIRPKAHKKIKKMMYLNSMFVHPAVMFCKDVIPLIGKYPTKYKSAEDYAYFFRFVKKYETANIDEILLQIEINPQGISILKRKEQVKNRIKIIWENFYFGFYPVYGLFRSAVLYIIPFRTLLFFKKNLLK